MGDEYGLVLVMKRGRVIDFTGNPEHGVRVYRTSVNLRGAKAARHELKGIRTRSTLKNVVPARRDRRSRGIRRHHRVRAAAELAKDFAICDALRQCEALAYDSSSCSSSSLALSRHRGRADRQVRRAGWLPTCCANCSRTISASSSAAISFQPSLRVNAEPKGRNPREARATDPRRARPGAAEGAGRNLDRGRSSTRRLNASRLPLDDRRRPGRSSRRSEPAQPPGPSANRGARRRQRSTARDRRIHRRPMRSSPRRCATPPADSRTSFRCSRCCRVRPASTTRTARSRCGAAAPSTI